VKVIAQGASWRRFSSCAYRSWGRLFFGPKSGPVFPYIFGWMMMILRMVMPWFATLAWPNWGLLFSGPEQRRALLASLKLICGSAPLLWPRARTLRRLKLSCDSLRYSHNTNDGSTLSPTEAPGTSDLAQIRTGFANFFRLAVVAEAAIKNDSVMVRHTRLRKLGSFFYDPQCRLALLASLESGTASE